MNNCYKISNTLTPESFNQNPKPSSLESVTKSDEYNNIGVVPANAHVEQKIKKQI